MHGGKTRRGVAALAASIVALVLAAPSWAAGPGEPDPTFDGDGFAFADFGKDQEGGVAIASTPDGGALLGTYWLDPMPLEFASGLVRFTPAGALDPSFGVGGLRSYPMPACKAEVETIRYLHVYPDNRILSGGSCDGDFILMRFNGDGSPDASFDGDPGNPGGGDGVVRTSFPVPVGASAMSVDPGDGSITVGGICCTGGPQGQNSALARYDANGVLDPAFDGPPANPGGENGRVIIAVDVAGDDRPEDLAALGGGRVAFTDAWQNETFVAVVGPDGKLDPAFSGDGRAEVDHPGSDEGEALAVDAAGRIVVASRGGFPEETYLARFEPDGSLDEGFGTPNPDPTPGESDAPVELEVEANGRIMLVSAGYFTVPESFSEVGSLGVARLLEDGEPDESFGPAGARSFLGPEGRAAPGDAALDPLGQLLVAGTSRSAAGEDPPRTPFAARILTVERFPAVAPIAGLARPRSNRFRIVGLRRNKRRGTAILVVRVPGPGLVRLVKNRKLRGAARRARRAGKVRIPVKLRGVPKRRLARRARRLAKLDRRGKRRLARIRVRARLVYRPARGRAQSRTKRFKLVKKFGKSKGKRRR